LVRVEVFGGASDNVRAAGAGRVLEAASVGGAFFLGLGLDFGLDLGGDGGNAD